MKNFVRLGIIFVLEVDFFYAATRNAQYSPLSKFVGKKCKDEDMVFEYRGRDSALSCSAICAAREDCYGVFYTKKTKACVGCGMYYPDGLNMEEGDPDTQPLYSCADTSDWSYHSGSYYKPFSLFTSKSNAKKFCLKQCSFLVHPRTSAEIDYVQQLASTAVGHGYWFAIKYDVDEKVWRWDDDQSLVTVFDWASIEPYKPHERQCVIIQKWYNYQMAAFHCGWPTCVMCETD